MITLRQRRPRERNTAHLKLVRLLPCLVCALDPAGEAAHVRMTRPGKPNAGVGQKPDDRYTLPLCHEHHSEQHRVGESKFWREFGIDPVAMAERLARLSPDLDAMRALVCAVQEDEI